MNITILADKTGTGYNIGDVVPVTKTKLHPFREESTIAYFVNKWGEDDYFVFKGDTAWSSRQPAIEIARLNGN